MIIYVLLVNFEYTIINGYIIVYIHELEVLILSILYLFCMYISMTCSGYIYI